LQPLPESCRVELCGQRPITMRSEVFQPTWRVSRPPRHGRRLCRQFRRRPAVANLDGIHPVEWYDLCSRAAYQSLQANRVLGFGSPVPGLSRGWSRQNLFDSAFSGHLPVNGFSKPVWWLLSRANDGQRSLESAGLSSPPLFQVRESANGYPFAQTNPTYEGSGLADREPSRRMVY